MRIEMSEKPRGCRFIIGFPGMGLVGPIVTEFLIEHMQTRQIGRFVYDELPPTVAIHKGELLNPMSLHYSAEHNALIFYTILNLRGNEWKVAEEILKLSAELDAKEILCIDGANAVGATPEQIFAFGDSALMELGAKSLEESVITGVSGALLLTSANVNCLFASVQTNMPDSKAAAAIVQFLDKYQGLDVDPEPLLKQAEVFEQKVKSLMKQTQDVERKDQMSYLG